MDKQIQDLFLILVDERIDSSYKTLEKEDAEYVELSDRLILLTKKVEELDIPSDDKAVVKDFMDTQFDQFAKEEQAIYIQGFSDGLQMFKMLNAFCLKKD